MLIVGHGLIGASEDDGCGDGDDGHERVSAPIIAGMDAPPTFELAGHDLDFLVLSVERGVVRDGDLAIGLGQDAGGTVTGRWLTAILGKRMI